MKKILALFISALCFMVPASVCAYEDIPVNFAIFGKAVSFPASPIIRDGVTYVDCSALCKALSLGYQTFSQDGSIVITSSRLSVCITPGEEYATVSDVTGKSDMEYSYRRLSAPVIYINGRPSVAARDIASVFAYPLSFDTSNDTVYFGYCPQMISAEAMQKAESSAYYFQNQAQFALPSSGSGYCWVCSYAMLISNITVQQVTPNDIAAINLSKGSSGAYCHHTDIVSAFNLRFVSALPEDSPYYGGRASVSGGTYIKNPNRDDATVTNAISEALRLHPEGVLVRYEGYPHTMLAVGFENGIVLFNDPSPSSSPNSENGSYRCVPFEQTTVYKKGFALSDITFLQAIGY